MRRLPTISVVVVSDYEAGTEKTWHDERRMLAALARQDIEEPFEVLLVENDAFRASVPEALFADLPEARVVFTDAQGSAALKDYGVSQARGGLIAVLEADARPNGAWLRVLAQALDKHPHIDVASGRTWYGNQTSYHRCLNLIDRAFDDMGPAGESPYISNNGALYRRRVLEAFPYPDAATPFLSARLRNALIRAAGHRAWFQPEARMRHAIGGLGFVRDVHRHVGYSDAITNDARSRGAIARLLWRRTRMEMADLHRLGRHYLRWYDLALLPVLMGLSRIHEMSGALTALTGTDDLGATSYR